MTTDKAIHFGRFVQWKRVNKRMSRTEFARKIGIDPRQLARIEKDGEPWSHETTIGGIAEGLGMNAEALHEAWQTTEVPIKPPRLSRRPKRVEGWPIELPAELRGPVENAAEELKVSVAQWLIDAIKQALPAEKEPDEPTGKDEPPRRRR